MPNLQAMVQPFADEELRTYDKTWKDKQGNARSMTLTYIEDETVMDRLDLGFGRGNWQIHVEPIPVYEGVVKVTLSVRVDPDQPWVSYQDFGYPNREGGESLKEAVSDGIRRCGRYLGIARDLYRKDTVARSHVAPQAPSAPAPRPVAPTPARSSTAVPEPPLEWDVLSKTKPEPFGAVAVLERDVDGAMIYGELIDRCNAVNPPIPIDALAQASKKLFGPKAWSIKALTDVQRYAVAIEVGLA